MPMHVLVLLLLYSVYLLKKIDAIQGVIIMIIIQLQYHQIKLVPCSNNTIVLHHSYS